MREHFFTNAMVCNCPYPNACLNIVIVKCGYCDFRRSVKFRVIGIFGLLQLSPKTRGSA